MQYCGAGGREGQPVVRVHGLRRWQEDGGREVGLAAGPASVRLVPSQGRGREALAMRVLGRRSRSTDRRLGRRMDRPEQVRLFKTVSVRCRAVGKLTGR